VPATYEPIETRTISSNASAVVFSSIPQTYTDLICVIDSRFTLTSGRYFGVQCNSDASSNYGTQYMAGTGSSAISAFFGDNVLRIGNGSNSNARSTAFLHVAGYSNTTTYTVSISRCSSNEYAISYTSSWRNNAAVTTLTFVPDTTDGNQFLSGSTFTIYGIKAA